jgi:dihydroneopterin aldolase
MNDAPPFDCVVIGAGPAGCSAASWAAQMGARIAVVDRAEAACASLAPLDFAQDWVLGEPQRPLRDIGAALAAHAAQRSGIRWHLGTAVTGLARLAAGWRVDLSDGHALETQSLILATGVRPVRPAAYFDGAPALMDAAGLTARRATLPPASRVLLLGGGDNALENAAYLAAQGHAVTLWARDAWRGQAALVEALASHPAIEQRQQMSLPTALRPLPGGGFEADSEAFGTERFDAAAVLFGYEPEPAPWSWLNRALAAGDAIHSALQPGQPDEALGIFVAGDVSRRWHPCVQTALADGVVAARQMEAWLHPASSGYTPPAPKAPLATLNSQILQLTGLRFGANLGVLAHERDGPQPIQVDAELNLGQQPALPRDAEIAHVLDYRKVRQIIIDECTAEHTDLLESLLAKLCVRLMRLPGVLGVRIRVAKLEIFDDCEVAIRCEAGKW